MTMRTADARQRRAGFTLIELGIVIVIIGILIAFILTVGGQGVRSAETRATQSLIAKLDAALDDLTQQIVNNRVNANSAHQYLAAIPNYQKDANNNYLAMITSDPRAQTIANVDNVRALIPEVWFYQPNVTDYPINCGAVPYDPLGHYSNPYSTSILPYAYAPFWLPMGTRYNGRFVQNDPNQITGSAYAGDYPDPKTQASLPLPPAPTGVFGANFGVRAGLTKNLGYLPAGYDGQDNDGNGLIDESDEGTGGKGTPLAAQITTRLNQHTHKTARSEMIYAVLVEGLGPYGAVLNRDDFTSKEVQDTDNDGMPEFVDAWGQPLQFYLWPFAYTSDSQKGFTAYANSSEPREQAPLDADQQLMAPAWWADSSQSSYPPPPYSGSVLFSSVYFPLFEVVASTATVSPGNSQVWDRQFLYPARRAYYTKPLVYSSGPDQNLGLYQLDDAFVKAYAASPATMTNPFQGFSNGSPKYTWTPGENSALSLVVSGQQVINPNHVDPRIVADPSYYINYGDDDLSNQTLYRPGGGIQ